MKRALLGFPLALALVLASCAPSHVDFGDTGKPNSYGGGGSPDRYGQQIEAMQRELAERLAQSAPSQHPDAAVPQTEPVVPVPSRPQPDCDGAADLRDRICELAERICTLAARDTSDWRLANTCNDARNACAQAKADVQRACGR